MMRWVIRMVLALELLSPAIAAAVTVSGTVRDGAPIPMPLSGIRVEVYDEDLLVDDLLDVVYADANGRYSSAAPEFGDDVYAEAKWEFQLLPSAFFNEKVIRIIDIGAGSPFVPVLTFESERSGTREDIVADFQYPDIIMPQARPPGLANLLARLQQTLDLVRNANGGAVAWNPDYDVPVHILNDRMARSSGDEIFIPTISLDGTGGAFWTVAIFHELAHTIHYHHNGGSFPPDEAGCSEHFINSEEDPGCALFEGYASYIAQLVAESQGIVSPTFRSFRDDGLGGLGFPANSLWRGDEGGNGNASARHTARDGGQFESGEIIEGAFGGFQFGIHDRYGFATNFRAMHDHDPDNAFEFCVGLVADAGGPGAPKTLGLYEIMQTHGIVFNRARFVDDPFDATEPPDAAPPPAGNHKEIDGFTFLRGTVTTSFEELSDSDLGVEDTVDSVRAKIGFKPSRAGLADSPALFTNFTPSASFGFFSGSIELDTTAFTASSGDGDWDLLVFAENADGFVDNLLPTWVGDGNVAVNTDEEYLKVLGAWFDRDRDPATNQDPEGKVVVDNSAPLVSNFKPQ